jgi:hypothetical protein
MRNIARTFWVSGLGAILSLGVVQGCGDDEDEGTGGRGGRGGSGGSGGNAGTAGGGGKAGSAGSGGTAGSAGSAGTAGDAGDSGSEAGDGGRALSCAYYCDVIMANCRDERDAGADGGNNAQYPTRSACEGACNSLDDRPGVLGETAGDTLACRIYHAEQSGENPVFHCPHAGQRPTMFCLDPDAGDAGGD